MADVKTEFVDNCGDRVTFMTSEIKGRLLRVSYVTDDEPKTPRWIEVTLMNTADREVCDKARIAGKLAAQKAYAVSGKRDADMAAARQGKLT